MNGQNLRLEWRSADELASNPANWRRHPPSQVKALKGVLADVGWAGALLYNEATGRLIDGHLRKEVARGQKVPVLVGSWTEAQEREILATLDPLGAMAQPDQDALIALLAQVETGSEDVKALLEALANSEALPMPNLSEEQAHATLAERFGVPPFSVLDARQGYWQDRKRAWLALGIRSELGRGGSGACNGVGSAASVTEGLARVSMNRASPGGSLRPAASLGPDGKTVRGDGQGRGLGRIPGQDLMKGEHVVGEKASAFKAQGRLAALQRTGDSRNLTWVKGDRQPETLDGTSRKNLAAGGSSNLLGLSANLISGQYEGHPNVTGTSIFDPVLCELAYRWFCPQAGRILDPFAGGSVRGIVAAYLGYDYTGIELRPEQVEANEEQAKIICHNGHRPLWVVGDGAKAEALAPGEYDLVFSCPPYYDLEVYSELEGELSALPTYAEFLKVYRGIIAKCLAMLKDNRFACFVVGDVRDKRGFYHSFPADTIAAFQEAGAPSTMRRYW